jgi:hypothetical protein
MAETEPKDKRKYGETHDLGNVYYNTETKKYYAAISLGSFRLDINLERLSDKDGGGYRITADKGGDKESPGFLVGNTYQRKTKKGTEYYTISIPLIRRYNGEEKRMESSYDDVLSCSIWKLDTPKEMPAKEGKPKTMKCGWITGSIGIKEAEKGDYPAAQRSENTGEAKKAPVAAADDDDIPF